MSQQRRPHWITLVEACALVLFTALVARLAVRLSRVLVQPADWVTVAAALPLGFVLADFFSGLVHWFFDTFLEEDSALGRIFVAPFREHHRDPMALTRHGFLELNGNSCLVMLPLLGRTEWRGPQYSPFAAAILLFLALGILATNQIHAWAHAPTTPRVIRWLQRRRLVLAPWIHEFHHRPGADGSYCVTLGWLNPPLDKLRFFRACGRLLEALGLPRGASGDSR